MVFTISLLFPFPGVYSNYRAIYICRPERERKVSTSSTYCKGHAYSSGPCVVLDERSLGNSVWWPSGHPGSYTCCNIHSPEHIVQGTYDLRKNYGEGTLGFFSFQNLTEYKTEVDRYLQFFFTFCTMSKKVYCFLSTCIQNLQLVKIWPTKFFSQNNKYWV